MIKVIILTKSNGQNLRAFKDIAVDMHRAFEMIAETLWAIQARDC